MNAVSVIHHGTRSGQLGDYNGVVFAQRADALKWMEDTWGDFSDDYWMDKDHTHLCTEEDEIYIVSSTPVHYSSNIKV